MAYPLLLDEMFSERIVSQLCDRGHDVESVVANRSLTALPDDRILAHAAAAGRAVVTMNIRDFVSLDALYREWGAATVGSCWCRFRAFPRTAPSSERSSAASPSW